VRILITGGFGYIGGRLGNFLAGGQKHHLVLGSRQTRNLPAAITQGEVAQMHWDENESLERACQGVAAVVHLAGMNAKASSDDPAAALEINGLATARLLKAAIRQNVKRFIYLSTAHVYRRRLIGDITTATNPSNLHPYATSHRAGEDVVLAAHDRREIEGAVIRLSNAYGAPTTKDVDCWTLLTNDLCRQTINVRQMILRSSGLQRRDFVTLSNTCEAIELLLKVPALRLGTGLFNVGGNWAPTILEMAQRVAERASVTLGIRPRLESRANGDAESDHRLKYDIRQIVDLGFVVADEKQIDRELDELLRFCAAQGAA